MKETKLWINGQWQDAEESYELASPYSGEVIAHVAKASIQDVESYRRCTAGIPIV